MKDILKKLTSGQDLTREEAKRANDILLSGEATQSQIGCFLTALRMKGETPAEIAGLAMALMEKAVHIHPQVDDYIDIVGTGGDGSNSFNISTTAAFVLAGAGQAVAKHGNRALSSRSGAGDVLEALGVNITADPKEVERAIEEIGIGFMFAQTFNPAMRFVGKARTEMGIRTVYNILGPLSNPSGAPYQLVGIYSPSLTGTMCRAMREVGLTGSMVMSSDTNMDELSTACPTTVSELRDGEIITYKITPEQFGFKRCDEKELLGGTAAENAAITRSILDGSEQGPKRDIVLLNAGAGLYVTDRAKSIDEGIQKAAVSIDSGKALEKLEALIAFGK
ncbi:MAG: anthranilate phosphoribosyltransferase [Lachnospiraceae bacterium]|nr:anthranilate phosphoribosyltransferase [Lachnospiraceae bacterium]